MSILVSPLYLFPPLPWWRLACGNTEVLLDVREPFRKMTCRNRYRIATANGALLLSVPVVGGRAARMQVSDAVPDYTQLWQKQHWRSLFSAYGRAPFFEHYGAPLEQLLAKQYKTLADLNFAALTWVQKELRLSPTFTRSDNAEYRAVELASSTGDGMDSPRYPQVFEDRHGFLPNLSILDLLMNEGPAAKRILMS